MKVANPLKYILIFTSLCIVALMTITMPESDASNQKSLTFPLYNRGASTFYIKARLGGLQKTELMLDTGSGYMTINEDTLGKLKQQGEVSFVKNIGGILANGSKLVVPVWRIRHIKLGSKCELYDVDAAIFPGKTRQILGLSALKKAGPLTLSFNPPQITLNHCMGSTKDTL